jgi:hypothetical protein
MSDELPLVYYILSSSRTDVYNLIFKNLDFVDGGGGKVRTRGESEAKICRWKEGEGEERRR